MCRTWSETPKTGFLASRLISQWIIYVEREYVERASPNPLKDEDTTYSHEQQRHSNQSSSNKGGIGQIRGAIPDALVTLQVESVVAPTYEVRELEPEGEYPTEDAHANRDGPPVIIIMMIIMIMMLLHVLLLLMMMMMMYLNY